MVTVLRAEGLRIVIYVNDHRPAHVHVFTDGEAKINLVGDNPPTLVWADAMSRRDVRRCMRVVADQLTLLLQKWEDLHGRPD